MSFGICHNFWEVQQQTWQTLRVKHCWYFVSFQNKILHPAANEILQVQMENVTGVKKINKRKKKKKEDDCWCQNNHPQDTAIQTLADANVSACRRKRTSVHTHRHTELRQLTASAPRPQVQWWPLLQPHLPLSCLILLVGSIIWLAVWVPVSCFPGDSQAPGAGRHWAEASPASAAAVWETERGAAQMWESGANRRYGWFQRRPCLLFHLFLVGRSRALDLAHSKTLSFCSRDE